MTGGNPEELYKTVRGIAPDLIVIFGDLYWRSIGTVGRDTMYVFENDSGPDGANHAQNGLFIARVPGALAPGARRWVAPAHRRDSALC